MSSGSKHTFLSVAVLAASVAFITKTYFAQNSEAVHLAVPSVSSDATIPAGPSVMRVCADPNNLPFSNDRGEGFENRIAQTIARDLGKSVVYYWRPQRRGFLRTTLLAGECDVVMGVPTSIETARVTRPYYRSTYVFVSRRDRHLLVRSLDDVKLRTLRIGIPITGDDYENPPPAQALADRRIFDNVHGYPVYGNYSQPHPTSGVVDAVRGGEVDVAIAWGPIAGFAARQLGPELILTPLPDHDGSVQFAFDMSMAVRRGDAALASKLDDAIERHRAELDQTLRAYGVPLMRAGSVASGFGLCANGKKLGDEAKATGY